MLYERPLNDRVVLWGGAEHEFGPADQLNLLVVGGGVQWSKELYAETSTFISSRGKAYQQLKFVASVPFNSDLILEPRGELNSAFQSDRKQGLVAGPTDLSLSIRLRMRRDHGLTPYTGLCWSNVLGGTARLAHRNGQSTQSIAALFGAGWGF